MKRQTAVILFLGACLFFGSFFGSIANHAIDRHYDYIESTYSVEDQILMDTTNASYNPASLTAFAIALCVLPLVLLMMVGSILIGKGGIIGLVTKTKSLYRATQATPKRRHSIRVAPKTKTLAPVTWSLPPNNLEQQGVEQKGDDALEWV